MCLVLASPSECDYGREKSGIKIFDLVRVITVKAKYCPQNISSSSILSSVKCIGWIEFFTPSKNCNREREYSVCQKRNYDTIFYNFYNKC